MSNYAYQSLGIVNSIPLLTRVECNSWSSIWPYLLKSGARVQLFFRMCFSKPLDSIDFLPFTAYIKHKTNWVNCSACPLKNLQDHLAWSKQSAVHDKFVSFQNFSFFFFFLLLTFSFFFLLLTFKNDVLNKKRNYSIYIIFLTNL